MANYIKQGEHENLLHPGDSCRQGWSWDFDDELTKMLWVNSLLIGMKCSTDGAAVFVSYWNHWFSDVIIVYLSYI